MFGLGIQEVIILGLLALGAGAVIVVVILNNSPRGAGRARPPGD